MKMRKKLWISFCVLGLVLGMRHDVAAQKAPGVVSQTPLEVQQALDEMERRDALVVPVAGDDFPRENAFMDPEGGFAQDDPVVAAGSSEGEVLAQGVVEGRPSLILDVLELKDMDIGDVLKLISKKSGLNIISGKNVVGKITIYLKNVDVRDALRIILEANNLAYVEDKGIIKVIPGQEFETTFGYKFGQDLTTKIIELKYAKVEDVTAVLNQLKGQAGKISSDGISNTIILIDRLDKVLLMEDMIKRMDIPVLTKVFELKYAKAEDITKNVETLLSKNVGKIEFDKRSNKLFITDTLDKLKEVAKMLQAFDQRHSEVMIEAKIVQVTLSDDYKLGIDWEAIVSDFHNLTLASQFPVFQSVVAGQVVDDNSDRGKLKIGTLAADDYEVLIEALDVVGKTNVLSNPRITVINNEEAKILVGSNEPYVTSQTTTSSSGPATTAETINFIEVGVKLFVTPTIHGDGYITMKIRPEVSSAANFLLTSTNNKIPIVETSQAETIVMVKDNATVVIGGLIKDEENHTVNKVPVLGDVPFLGRIFRSETRTKDKTEIVIFLTPKIVTGENPSKTNNSAESSK